MRRYLVPGRVELVGKHVDYGGGRSITCAVSFALRASAQPIKKRLLRVRQRGSAEVVEVPIDASARATRARWSTYVAAVARRIGRDFPNSTGGVEVRISSKLPPAAGLSSSTALTTALARAVVEATGVTSNPIFHEHAGTPIGFAEYVAAIETGAAFGPFEGDAGVGVRGGAQDHVAIMCAREGMVGQFSYIPAREEGYAPWPDGQSLVIGVSGVKASKTGNAQAAYNRAADAVRWLVRQWNGLTYRNDATLAAALASGPDASERMERIARDASESGDAPVSAEYLTRRLAQFREECGTIVPGALDAFRRAELSRIGTLVDRSQQMAEEALENQVPETIYLCRSARELGAHAASAFGAGFGGAVWTMVADDKTDEFIAAWSRAYASAFKSRAQHAKFLVTHPGPPAGADSRD
jgi:galactokinase